MSNGLNTGKRILAVAVIGVFCGSMLEYLSNYCGINGLVIAALGLYMLSYMVTLNKVETRLEA